jgi:hypothetical protein
MEHTSGDFLSHFPAVPRRRRNSSGMSPTLCRHPAAGADIRGYGRMADSATLIVN